MHFVPEREKPALPDQVWVLAGGQRIARLANWNVEECPSVSGQRWPRTKGPGIRIRCRKPDVLSRSPGCSLRHAARSGDESRKGVSERTRLASDWFWANRLPVANARVSKARHGPLFTLSVFRVLRLRGIQLEGDRLFRLIQLKDVAEGLIVLGDHLDLDFAHRDLRDGRQGLPGSSSSPSGQFFHIDRIPAMPEVHDHAGAVDRFSGIGGVHLNRQVRLCRVRRQWKHEQRAKITQNVRIAFIMRYPGAEMLRGLPAAALTASAARYPLRTAPSIVAGQPERVQSPARKKLRKRVAAHRAQRFEPGLRRKRRAHFLNDLRFLQTRLFHEREKTRPVRAPPASMISPAACRSGCARR